MFYCILFKKFKKRKISKYEVYRIVRSGFLITFVEVSSVVEQGPAIVTSFTLQDIVDVYIYYEQKDHRNKEPVWDGFLFTVTDGNNTTPVHRLNITITVRFDKYVTSF